MATAGDVVTRAYRLFGGVRVGKAPTSEQSSYGLDALNDLLSNWSANEGIDLGLYSLASSDTVDADLVEPLVYNLSSKLMMEYPRLQRPLVVAEAVRMKASLAVQEMDTDMAYDGFRRSGFDIDADR